MLRRLLPHFATIANPLDYNTSLWGHRQELVRCFSTLLADPFDAAMLVVDYPHEGIAGRAECDISADALIQAADAVGIPAFIASTLPELIPPDARQPAITAGAAPLQGLPEAMSAVAAAMNYRERREQARRSGFELLRLPRLTPIGGTAMVLNEAESKARLAGFGVPVPAGHCVPAEQASEAAQQVGFPVAVKVLAPFLAHKTEAGAVAVGLRSAAEVRTAVAGIRLPSLPGVSAQSKPCWWRTWFATPWRSSSSACCGTTGWVSRS